MGSITALNKTLDFSLTSVLVSTISIIAFRSRGYKTFFMLNSAEDEIFSANKYENANYC